MPLDPFNRTREASINRAVIIEMPGIELPADVRGRRAYDLLSAIAVSAAIKPYKAALGLADNTPDTSLPSALDRCLQSGDDAIRDQADAVAAIIGVRLGCLLLLLKRGDAVNRQARAEWDASYWAHWVTIQRVIIGGGLNRHVLGQRIAHHAQAFLRQHSLPDMVVDCANYATQLPLIGAARSVPVGTSSALIFDFGQTQVKQARAVYERDALVALSLLPALTSECDTQDPYAVGDEAQAKYRANFMLQTITKAAQQANTTPSVVMCSLASYVQHGQPADRGCYGVLGLLSDNVEQYFADRLSADLGFPVAFRLMHDGTSAAAAYAGAEHAAVITMGTALGIGFPPPAERVHPLAADFSVDDLNAYD